MKRGMGWFLVLALVGVGLIADTALGASGARERGVTLLVAPARPRVIQLAFDLIKLRSVAVVSWHGDAKTAEPVLHVWSGSDWQYVSLPAFSDKSFLPGAVSQAIVIGDDQIVPAVLLNSMPWCSDVKRIQTINIADLVNGLDQSLKFRDDEWQWLAGRNELTLTDQNAERRKYNPYDTPRSKMPLEKREFKQQRGELPPAQLIEDKAAPAPTATKPDSAPAEKPLK